MSTILEFTIAPDDFELGRVLAGQEAGRIELERIIPAGNVIIPFFWVSGGEKQVLEADVVRSDYIENLTAIEEVGDQTLYRVEWTGKYEDLLEGINAADATILEARADGKWFFRLRFLDHQRIADFYNFCTEKGLDIHVERVYSLLEESEQGRLLDLTPEQRDALVLALESGYFDTPRKTTMSDLAAELGISQQSFSDRLRRGNEKVLRNVLLERRR